MKKILHWLIPNCFVVVVVDSINFSQNKLGSNIPHMLNYKFYHEFLEQRQLGTIITNRSLVEGSDSLEPSQLTLGLCAYSLTSKATVVT